ncbi:MAG: hypothetical protein LAQ69_45015 [Acidobacteriia bacterium]|nr:hypothetical protein [Terriglobia bacterium]
MKRISGSSFMVLPVILASLATLTVAAAADVVTFFPGPVDTGVPAYARIERTPVDGKPLVHHDKDWAVIYFYRDPACVPVAFNLLDFVDAPKAFDCSMTVVGSSTWKNGPSPLEEVAFETVTYGTGKVPVWFVRWDALRAAIADNTLTMSELNDALFRLRGGVLKGTASFLKETLRPYVGPGVSGGVELEYTMTMVEARGLLEDGRTFDFQSFENFQTEKNDIESKTVTIIRFK